MKRFARGMLDSQIVDFGEASSDARQNLNDWLDYAPKDVDNLLITLQRAHKAACVAEPVTAMILLPLIEQTAAVKAKLSELIGLREVKP